MIKNPFSIFSIFLIKFYRYFLSSYLGNNCRFIPSCSEYAIDSFNNYGFFRAFYLTTKRLLKCHPFGGSGYDPVVRKEKIIIKEVSVGVVQKFRKVNLYDNLPHEFSKYNEDSLKSSIHLALYSEENLISALSLIKKEFLNNTNSFQIRGMFTIKSQLNKGYGSKLLTYVKEKKLNNKASMIWCNSRFDAINFYKKHGFVEYEDFFMIDKIGKHKRLYYNYE